MRLDTHRKGVFSDDVIHENRKGFLRQCSYARDRCHEARQHVDDYQNVLIFGAFGRSIGLVINAHGVEGKWWVFHNSCSHRFTTGNHWKACLYCDIPHNVDTFACSE
eukprot:6192726-Pleurochrysis_carterae.AAC.2